jgi:hypothetical protein
MNEANALLKSLTVLTSWTPLVEINEKEDGLMEHEWNALSRSDDTTLEGVDKRKEKNYLACRQRS